MLFGCPVLVRMLAWQSSRSWPPSISLWHFWPARIKLTFPKTLWKAALTTVKRQKCSSVPSLCVPCILLQVLDLKEQKKSGKKTSQELEKSRKENADLQTQLQQTQQQLEKVQGCILSVSPTRWHCWVSSEEVNVSYMSLNSIVESVWKRWMFRMSWMFHVCHSLALLSLLGRGWMFHIYIC